LESNRVPSTAALAYGAGKTTNRHKAVPVVFSPTVERAIQR